MRIWLWIVMVCSLQASLQGSRCGESYPVQSLCLCNVTLDSCGDVCHQNLQSTITRYIVQGDMVTEIPGSLINPLGVCLKTIKISSDLPQSYASQLYIVYQIQVTDYLGNILIPTTGYGYLDQTLIIDLKNYRLCDGSTLGFSSNFPSQSFFLENRTYTLYIETDYSTFCELPPQQTNPSLLPLQVNGGINYTVYPTFVDCNSISALPLVLFMNPLSVPFTLLIDLIYPPVSDPFIDVTVSNSDCLLNCTVSLSNQLVCSFTSCSGQTLFQLVYRYTLIGDAFNNCIYCNNPPLPDVSPSEHPESSFKIFYKRNETKTIKEATD